MLQREHLSSSKDSKQVLRRRYLAHPFCPSCDAHLPRLVPEPMNPGSCYETASAGCSMYSDLPVPGVTGRSRMKVRTPRGQMQPLKAPCLSGGPSMPCCAHLRPTTSGRRTHRSAVCARSARAGQLRKLSRTQALLRKHTHPGPERVYRRGSSRRLPFSACHLSGF
jgi:hypothetical protein